MMEWFLDQKTDKMDLHFEENTRDPYMLLIFSCRARIEENKKTRELIRIQLMSAAAANPENKDIILKSLEEYTRILFSGVDLGDEFASNDTITKEMVDKEIADFYNYTFKASERKIFQR